MREPTTFGRGEAIDGVLIARARAAAEEIAPLASRIESERRLPSEAVDALVRAGVFKLFVPKIYGGARRIRRRRSPSSSRSRARTARRAGAR